MAITSRRELFSLVNSFYTAQIKLFLYYLVKCLIDDWEEKFGFLKKEAVNHMNEKEMTVEELNTKFEYCLPQRFLYLRKYIEKSCRGINEIKKYIQSLDRIWSFVDYELFSFVVDRLKNEKLSQKMSEYEDKINDFFDTITIDELITGMKPNVKPKDVKDMKSSIMSCNWNPKKTTVKRLKDLQQTEIPKMFRQNVIVSAFSICKTFRSSVTVVWKFWTNSVDQVVESARDFILTNPEFIITNKIFSFIMNGIIIYSEPGMVSIIAIREDL